jgi:hypothetical protein
VGEVHLAGARRAFAAIVDLREGATFGKVETVDLHPGNALFVPRGCGNSYQTTTPDVVYTYLVNAHWSPSAKYTLIQAFDPELGIPWPIGEADAIRSDADRGTRRSRRCAGERACERTIGTAPAKRRPSAARASGERTIGAARRAATPPGRMRT